MDGLALAGLAGTGRTAMVFQVLTDVFCLSVCVCVWMDGWVCTRNSWCVYNRAERACSCVGLVSLVWCFSDCLVLSYDVLVIPGTSWSDGSRPLLPFSVVLDCGGLVWGHGGREVWACGVDGWCGEVWTYVYIWLRCRYTRCMRNLCGYLVSRQAASEEIRSRDTIA
jgi:hypothetical protein